MFPSMWSVYRMISMSSVSDEENIRQTQIFHLSYSLANFEVPLFIFFLIFEKLFLSFYIIFIEIELHHLPLGIMIPNRHANVKGKFVI